MSWNRSHETSRRLKNLYKKTKNHYARGAYYDNDKERYIQFQMSRKGRGNYISYVKKKCNRIVRRNRFSVPNGKGSYRKMSEFWWEIW